MVVDIDAGKVVVPPEIHARGFAEDDAVFDEIRPRVVTAVEDALREGLGDTHQLQQVVRRTVGSVGRWPPPPSSDDHPRGRRGLALPTRMRRLARSAQLRGHRLLVLPSVGVASGRSFGAWSVCIRPPRALWRSPSSACVGARWSTVKWTRRCSPGPPTRGWLSGTPLSSTGTSRRTPISGWWPPWSRIAWPPPRARVWCTARTSSCGSRARRARAPAPRGVLSPGALVDALLGSTESSTPRRASGPAASNRCSTSCSHG